jgi:hypothetical protein
MYNQTRMIERDIKRIAVDLEDLERRIVQWMGRRA